MSKYIIDDWAHVLRVSYSSWFQLAGIALLIVPELLFYMLGRDVNPQVVFILALVFLIFGWVGRFLKQDRAGAIFRRVAIGISLVLLGLWAGPAVAMGSWSDRDAVTPAAVNPDASEWSQVRPHMVPLVAKWEGMHPCNDDRSLHCSYLDRIASPPLWTVCYGHTVSASAGQRFTDAHCLDLLGRDAREYWHGWREAVTVTPPAEAQGAFGSLSYNIGIGAARGSTATRRLNAGQNLAACDAIGWWNKAGGRVRRGLQNRRADEVAQCRRAYGAS